MICGSFEEKAKSIPKQSFHAYICVGAFLTPGFLDPSVSIQEMIRLIEEGVFFVVAGQSECKSTMKSLEAVCGSIMKNGLCECVQKSTIPNYLEDCNGIMWIFQRKQCAHVP